MVSHSLPEHDGWKADAYLDAINNTAQWQYRAEEKLDEHYTTLSGALRESLIKNDYATFELVAAIFRTILNSFEGDPQLGSVNYFTEDFQPGRLIVLDAFSSAAAPSPRAALAAIGSKWMTTLGPLSPRTQPDIIWDDVGSARDAYGDPIEPDPGFFGVTWTGLDGQEHQFIEQSSEPEWEVRELEVAAAGVGSHDYLNPVISETCGGTFADYIAYLVFPTSKKYNPNPKFVWEQLSPVVRKVLGLDTNSYHTTINRHFLA